MVALLGNRIVREHGDVRLAARKIQEIEMRKCVGQSESAKSLLRNHPALRDDVIQLHTIGAMPHFRGGEPDYPRPSGLPYDESKSLEMVEKIWKDAKEGRALVISPHVSGSDAPLIATPATTAQKRLPDRTLSTDFRIISDLRYTNLFCDKSDYPEVRVTDMEKIAERLVALEMRWPGLRTLCNKRDIDSAFKRIRVHPDASEILRTEFRAELFGIDDPDATLIFLYLVLPFGWRASPGYFSRLGEGISTSHREYQSGHPERDGKDHFDPLLFVGDAIFIEPSLGHRQEMVVGCWEYICKKLLGASAVNDEKKDIEGSWQETHILLGFEVNVHMMEISLPAAKRSDSWDILTDPVLNPGNRVIPAKMVHQLRGLINHWRYANKFRHYVASPVNALMACADNTNTWIRCDNDQIWLAFWNLISLVGKMGNDADTWGKIFHGELDQVISVAKRIGQPRGSGAVTWATGDAVIEK